MKRILADTGGDIVLRDGDGRKENWAQGACTREPRRLQLAEHWNLRYKVLTS